MAKGKIKALNQIYIININLKDNSKLNLKDNKANQLKPYVFVVHSSSISLNCLKLNNWVKCSCSIEFDIKHVIKD